MKAIVFAVLLGAIGAQTINFNCDCRKWPWKPKDCFSVCAAKVINASTPAELNALGLPEALITTLTKEREKKPFQSMEDLSSRTLTNGRKFGKEDLAAIEDRISKATFKNRDVSVQDARRMTGIAVRAR